jgi:hypothetical protein
VVRAAAAEQSTGAVQAQLNETQQQMAAAVGSLEVHCIPADAYQEPIITSAIGWRL